jgi:hypothetical protein
MNRTGPGRPAIRSAAGQTCARTGRQGARDIQTSVSINPDTMYVLLYTKSAIAYLMSIMTDSPLPEATMSWIERAPLAQALRALIVYGWYLSRQRDLAAAGALDGPGGLQALGWEILLLIIVTIGVGIVIQIIAVVLAIATGQESGSGIDDERDKLIEARAMVRGFTFVGFGFLGMALALWQGWGAVWAVNLMLAGMVACDLVVCLIRFLRYWRGV